MNKFFRHNNRKLILMIFLSFLGLFFYSLHLLFAATSTSTDAIAIRVMQNPQHLSPADWYAGQKFAGSPQALLVDGYEAIRDGRTVYVGASNIVDQGGLGILDKNDLLYTNLYIISYNNDAQQQTEDIFGQILAHWKFNINLTVPGVCHQSATSTCVYATDCKNNDYCVGSKSIAIRDVKRLADLAKLNQALTSYQNSHNSLCPTMDSGSYLPNKTVSTWPSWQATLGANLGASLPIDPINQLGKCKTNSVDNAKYNPTTCWDETDKLYAASSSPVFSLPTDSLAYTYISSPDGRSCSFYAVTEAGLTCDATGACKVNNNQTDPKIFGQTPINNGPNNPPVITGTNFPAGATNLSYLGFVSATDPEGDNINWSLSLTGDWSSWTAPTLTKTNVANQMQLTSLKVGKAGDYGFTITVSDTKGSSTVSSYNLKVNDLCDDKDGDGYGVCPNCGKAKGCKYDGNDCDDTAGLHTVNGALGPVQVDGKDINSREPDDCTQYDGVDHNCDGQANNHAQVTQVIGTQVQDMEQVNPLTELPFGWFATNQAHSNVQLSTAANHTLGGANSILIHQDANILYSGSCDKTDCTDPDVIAQTGCTWDDVGQRCLFTNGDACNDSSVKAVVNGVNYEAVYNSGDAICWGHNNITTWGSLNYDISTYPFNVGDTYILQYYYKGSRASSGLNNTLSYNTGWGNACYLQNLLATSPCDGYTPWSGYRALPGDPANCASYNAGGVYNMSLASQCTCLLNKNSLANQTDCYSYLSGIAFLQGGVYPDWTLRSDSFKYDTALDQIKNPVTGARQLIFGMSFGYDDTGPLPQDLYVDDLNLLKCTNK